MSSTCCLNPDLIFVDPDVPIVLEKINSMHHKIQYMVEVLSKCIGDYHKIGMYSPVEMYSQVVWDSIPFVELLQPTSIRQ